MSAYAREWPILIRWEPHEIDAARRMWDDGLSAREIGDRLNRTRNAVIGLANRQGFQKKRAPAALAPDRPTPARRVTMPTQKSPRHADPIPPRPIYPRLRKASLHAVEALEPASLGVALMNLTNAQCHWPATGAGSVTLFCGHPVHEERPYCLHHCQRAYRAAEKRAHQSGGRTMVG